MVFVLLLVWIFLPSTLFAQQNPPVLINEIAWMGSFVDEVDVNQYWRYEWLELHNTKDVSFTLDGWSIELYRKEELYFMIPLAGTISANGYFLVAASDKIPNVDVNYANLSGKFVNSGMRVILKNSIGEIIDEVDANSGWFAGGNSSKRTMERAQDGWQASMQAYGTPKAKNSEGFEELVPELFSFTNKKDPSESFLKESVFSPPAFLAGGLALLSALLILLLRRVLVRRA